MMQVDIHLRRVLIDEVEALRLGLLTVGRLLRVEDQRHILIAAANLTQQFQSSLRITLFHMGESARRAVHRETGVGDDTERILVILLVEGHRFFIVRGEHHLRTTSLALGSGMGVQGLSREALRLRKDVIIQIRQYGRIEADIILDQENHLHTGLADIVIDVHLVLKQFDDRHDEVGVAKPAEDIVEHRHILVLNTLGDTMRERRQHHAGNIRMSGLHLTGHCKGIVVGITRHTDHEVDVGCL